MQEYLFLKPTGDFSLSEPTGRAPRGSHVIMNATVISAKEGRAIISGSERLLLDQ